jgi:serine/threonine protein kinase
MAGRKTMTALAQSVDELLLRWQEQRQAGQPVSAEDLCASSPELADELRKQIAAFESMEALLGVGPDQPTTATGLTDPDSAISSLDPHAIPGYELLGVLGQGGMGVVYKARQLRPRRLVALKMCLAGAHAAPEQRSRFRTEAEAAAALHHPNIVQIYDVGEFRGQPYFAMELVEGNLAEQLAQSVMPAHEAAELLRILADAVAAAHEQGIVHRDLKPANVLLESVVRCPSSVAEGGMALATDNGRRTTDHGHPKITDFGLAKRLDPEAGDWQTQTGAILGTACYMAPEQADTGPERKRRDAGSAVDIYALGAILYEMLAGRPPFKGETLLDTLEQVRSREPVPLSRLQLSVPRDLETICLKCLAKEPSRRYLSARALADDLRRYLAGEPILARRASAGEKVLKWMKRKPAQAALVLVSTVAIFGLLGGWLWFTMALHEEREAVHKNWTAATEQRDRADLLLTWMCSAVEEHAVAMTKAKDDPNAASTPGEVLYALARTYSRSAASTNENGELPAADRQQLAERYAARAVRLLNSAAALGYFQDRSRLQRLNEPELAVLRDRADFQELIKKFSGGS